MILFLVDSQSLIMGMECDNLFDLTGDQSTMTGWYHQSQLPDTMAPLLTDLGYSCHHHSFTPDMMAPPIFATWVVCVEVKGYWCEGQR